jgi:hypothetical protein
LRAPGQAVNVHEMDLEKVTLSIAWLRERYRNAA